ncbi:hypothetical protein [Streptomyces sp. NPDC059564]|uniref:hypothetical protein n=1 Tax=Streptomyces sp. NPDC059564 TaxID=3346865 RepID=UPI0036B0E4EE
MNRHSLLTLLAAPLLIAPAALTPAFAAPAAVPAAASCELVAIGEDSYTLVLEGFAPGQSVTINGPRTNQRVQVGQEGSLQQDDARYGKYSVGFKTGGSGHGNRIGCLTPPRGKHDGGGGKGNVQVTKVEVFTLTKPGTVVDCTKPIKAEFDGKISGTGKGDVRYFWTFASSADPIQSGKVTFAPGTESHSLFVAVPLSVVNNGSPSGFVTLHVPSANMTARSDQVTLTCAKP